MRTNVVCYSDDTFLNDAKRIDQKILICGLIYVHQHISNMVEWRYSKINYMKVAIIGMVQVVLKKTKLMLFFS